MIWCFEDCVTGLIGVSQQSNPAFALLVFEERIWYACKSALGTVPPENSYPLKSLTFLRHRITIPRTDMNHRGLDLGHESCHHICVNPYSTFIPVPYIHEDGNRCASSSTTRIPEKGQRTSDKTGGPHILVLSVKALANLEGRPLSGETCNSDCLETQEIQAILGETVQKKQTRSAAGGSENHQTHP